MAQRKLWLATLRVAVDATKVPDKSDICDWFFGLLTDNDDVFDWCYGHENDKHPEPEQITIEEFTYSEGDLFTDKEGFSYLTSTMLCAHPRVEAHFWSSENLPEGVNQEELIEQLNLEFERRANELIPQNIIQGELNYEDDRVSLRGWWRIIR